MHYFVTGASGFVGSAVVPELIGAGHTVTGLSRSDAAAEALAAAGARVQRGSLDDLDILRAAAADSDGVIHLAFKHDIAFSGHFDQAAEADRVAVAAFGDVLAGSGRPLVIASGIPGGHGGVTTERDGIEPASLADLPEGPRARQATAVLARSLAEKGVRSSVVRLPIVHGEGDPGFLATLVGIARDKGVSGYVGDGGNHWTSVHDDDAARLFRLAAEGADAGSTLHAVDDEGVTLREIAGIIGRHLDLPVASIAPEDASAHFGWLATFAAFDQKATSALTRKSTGWAPTGPGLIEDLETGHYFKEA